MLCDAHFSFPEHESSFCVMHMCVLQCVAVVTCISDVMCDLTDEIREYM